jgi:putative heme-binding domain-containing protein
VLKHQELRRDAYIPLLCWWVFEAHIPSANEQVLALFKSAEVWDEPMVFEHILPRLARRYAVEGKRSDLLLCAELFRCAPKVKHAAQLMKGLEEGFRGRAMSGLPEELMAAMAKSGEAPLAFRLKQGEHAAVPEALNRMQDSQARIEERLLLVRAFADVKYPDAVTGLLAIASSSAPVSLRKAALAALSSYDDQSIGQRTAAMLPKLTGDVRTAAFTLLASRSTWSPRLIEAVQLGNVSIADLPQDIAQRLGLLPEPKGVAPASRTRTEELHAIIKSAPGNPYQGEAAYHARCGACHKLFFKGGNVGPDLTNYQRDNLSTMLLSIIDPSVEIREGFQYYTLETKDGRTLSGFFVERDNQVTVLRGLDGENHTLRSSEILEAKPMGRSLMPDGLLDGMTDQELRDLFAYLASRNP